MVAAGAPEALGIMPRLHQQAGAGAAAASSTAAGAAAASGAVTARVQRPWDSWARMARGGQQRQGQKGGKMSGEGGAPRLHPQT